MDSTRSAPWTWARPASTQRSRSRFVKTDLLSTLPREVLSAPSRVGSGTVAEPEDVARVILFLCSEGARNIRDSDRGGWRMTLAF